MIRQNHFGMIPANGKYNEFIGAPNTLRVKKQKNV